MDLSNFTRKDVESHLADLGYTNITDEKLDSFIKDLRKLIKYEERKKSVSDKLNLIDQEDSLPSHPRLSNKQPDSSTSMEESRAPRRRIRRKDKREKITVDESSSLAFKSRRDEEEFSRDSVDCSGGASRASSRAETQSSLYIDVDLAASESTRSSRDSDRPLAASLLNRPASSSGFIRVQSGPNLGRKAPNCDPVSLHQKYREQWAKVPIPGERSHSKLRWAIRGWMMGEEPNS